MKIKLYKIKQIKYNQKKNCFEFDLLVPYKKKKYTLTFPYQSESKAALLLEQFAKLNLAKLPEDSQNKSIDIKIDHLNSLINVNNE
jgi:hypothetical protein